MGLDHSFFAEQPHMQFPSPSIPAARVPLLGALLLLLYLDKLHRLLLHLFLVLSVCLSISSSLSHFLAYSNTQHHRDVPTPPPSHLHVTRPGAVDNPRTSATHNLLACSTESPSHCVLLCLICSVPRSVTNLLFCS
jgi:hypothetical protein